MKALLDFKLSHQPLAAGCIQFAAVLTIALLAPLGTIQATAKRNARSAAYDSTNGMSPKVLKILSRVGKRYDDLKSFRFSGTDEMTITVDKSTYRHTNGVEIASGGTPQTTGCLFSGVSPIEKIAGNGPARPNLKMIISPGGRIYEFGKLPEEALSAKLVGEGSLEANGKTVRCYIIQLRWRPPVDGSPQVLQDGVEALWIGKVSHLVLRTRFNKFNDVNSVNPHVVERWTTTFSSYQLNGPLPKWALDVKQRSEELDRALSARMTGKPAPSFALDDLDGKSVSLDNLRGKIVVLDFWATWCGPCRKEEPVLEKLGEKWGNGSLAILRITDQSSELVRRFLQRTGERFPTLVDGGGVFRKYRVRGVPTLVIIGRAGKIVAYHAGFLSESLLEAVLRAQGI